MSNTNFELVSIVKNSYPLDSGITLSSDGDS